MPQSVRLTLLKRHKVHIHTIFGQVTSQALTVGTENITACGSNLDAIKLHHGIDLVPIRTLHRHDVETL